MPAKTLTILLGSLALLLGAAPAIAAELARLEVEIQEPVADLVLTGKRTSIEVRGGASVFGGVKQLDLFFVLDTSSSLKRTDPNDYRTAGAIGLIESLPDWSDVQIGLVAFGRRAKLVTPLSANRGAVVEALRELGRGSTTNIADGINTALAGFESDGRQGSSRVMLIFTDGKSDEEKARRAMQTAAERGIAIHSLLLGKNERGEKMLRGISEGTGGGFIRVTDPAGLPEAFLDLRTTGVEGVALQVNDSAPIPAALRMGSFLAEVPLAAGENRIVATATSRDGQTRTDAVTVTVRPDGCAELTLRAVRNGKPTLSISDRSVEIVIDASRSMWGQIDGKAKMEIAKEILAEALDWLPPDLTLSLRAYGHQHAPAQNDCQDTRLLVQAGSDNRDDIRSAIARLRPKGQTPLGYAVEQLARDLGDVRGERAVVLVTDGVESCGGDAPAAARALQNLGRIPVHVIGFGMQDAEAEDLASLQAIADASGGKFATAGSAEELRKALTTSVGTPFRVRLDDANFAGGTLGANETLRLPAGEYSLQLDSSPPQEVRVSLDSEMRHTLVFSRDRSGTSHAVSREPAEYSRCDQSTLAVGESATASPDIAPEGNLSGSAPARADSSVQTSSGQKARRTMVLEVENGSVEVWQNLRPNRSADWGVMVRHPSLARGARMIHSGNDPQRAEQAALDARDSLRRQGSLDLPTPH